MEFVYGFEWLAQYQSGWQFGEQGVLKRLCDLLHVVYGVEIGAGNGTTLPVTLDFLPVLTLFEIDQAKQDMLRVVFPHADVQGGFDESSLHLIPKRACVVVDVDCNDLELALLALQRLPRIIMVEHYDTEGPFMASSKNDTPIGIVPEWLLGMRLFNNFVIQQPLANVREQMKERGYLLVAESRVNGIYLRVSDWYSLHGADK